MQISIVRRAIGAQYLSGDSASHTHGGGKSESRHMEAYYSVLLSPLLAETSRYYFSNVDGLRYVVRFLLAMKLSSTDRSFGEGPTRRLLSSRTVPGASRMSLAC